MNTATLENGFVRSLFDYREGFGEYTTGGLGGEVYLVTNLNDSGPGSLRFAAEDRSNTPIWIVFDPALHGGVIDLDSTIYLGANRTIDGRGSDIDIIDYGITIGGNWGASNDIIAGIEIRDLIDPGDDNISIYGVTNIWIHSVSLSGDANDGLLDITDGTQNVTVDWTYFSNSNHPMIINSYSTSPDPNNPNGEILNGHELDNYVRDSDTHVTLHHNVFDDTVQREPRAIFGEVHMYNNLHKDWDAYAIGSSFRAEILVEGEIFDTQNSAGSQAIITQVGIDPEPGFVKSVDNLFLGTASGGSHNPQNVFIPPYEYQYETPTLGLKARLLEKAGSDAIHTLDIVTINIEEQVASTYIAFFGRGADADGFNFWVNEFITGLPIKGPSGVFAAVADSFGTSDEAMTLYPFLETPSGENDPAISVFINNVYDNLFNRGADAEGLAYWTSETKSALLNGNGVGSILLNIISGAQDTALWSDITTLKAKVTVNLEYVEAQEVKNTEWTMVDDYAESRALIDAVTDGYSTLLIGIMQAHALVNADF